DKYVAEILKKFDFASVKTASTPIETQKSLTKDEEAVDMDVHLYRSMIGSLMYLTASRPNIMFAVCACFRFQVTPKTSHLNAVKRIFRYQKGKPKLGLWYPRVSSFDLEAYSDSDYSGANLDRKSTTGVSAASLVNTARPTLSAARLVVTEASIRSSLLLNDVNGTACLTNEAIFQNLALMGNLDNPKKKFLMYPRFLMVFLNNQIELGEPFNDVYITPAHTLKVFSNMSRKGLKFLGRITPLFPNMLASAEVEEGKGSEQPTEPQPTPSPTQPSVGDQPHVPESSSGPDNTHSPSINLEGTGRNKGIRVLALETSKDAQAVKILKLKIRIKKLEKKCKPNISHHRAWLKSVKRLSMKKRLGKKESVSKQGRKNVKPGPTLDAFEALDDDLVHGMDYMETKEAVNKGGSNEEPVNAAGNIGVSTAVNISTASRPDVSIATPMTPPTITNVFEDEDSFLADALVMLSDKAKLKGVEIKEMKDVERPARSVLTLKPLPKFDPKDKGKGVLEEEPEPVKVKSKDQSEAQIERDAEIV
ncbi:hypothetical protein Tco_1137305, partial [Tanacetum coccineum]